MPSASRVAGTRRLSRASGCAVAIAAIGAALAQPAAADPRTVPGAPGIMPACVHIYALDALLAPLADAAAPAAQPPAENPMRPPSEREVDQLIRALEPLQISPDKGGGKTIRAVAEGTELSPVRLRVLVDDMVAILAGLHAREMLGELKSARDMPARDRALGIEQLGRIGRCLGLRFAERGGAGTLREAERIVVKYRPQLEKLLLAELSEPLPR